MPSPPSTRPSDARGRRSSAFVREDSIADVDTSGLWPGKVVTEVTPAGPFWEAEPEHQDYLLRYPHGYTCHFPRPGWVLPRRGDVASRPSSQLT
jgi:peptide-methionine (S)-S-oxide reductase